MQTTNPSRFALRCLSAANLAPSLCDEIAAIQDHNMAVAKAKTIQQSKALLRDALATLPPPFKAELSDDDLTALVCALL